MNLGDCPLIDHLGCKLPGELEPRVYDVFGTITDIAAGAFRPKQVIEISNRDAPFHLAAVGVKEVSGTGRLYIRIYNSRGSGISDDMEPVLAVMGGLNAPDPINPSLVWPVNASLQFDLQNNGAGAGTFQLFFYGFKLYDRGKAPC